MAATGQFGRIRIQSRALASIYIFIGTCSPTLHSRIWQPAKLAAELLTNMKFRIDNLVIQMGPLLIVNAMFPSSPSSHHDSHCY
jgi:hypothetical protein